MKATRRQTEREARASLWLDVTVRVDRGYLRQKFLLSKSLEAAEAWTYEAVVVRYVTYYAQNQYYDGLQANICVTTTRTSP